MTPKQFSFFIALLLFFIALAAFVPIHVPFIVCAFAQSKPAPAAANETPALTPDQRIAVLTLANQKHQQTELALRIQIQMLQTQLQGMQQYQNADQSIKQLQQQIDAKFAEAKYDKEKFVPDPDTATFTGNPKPPEPAPAPAPEAKKK